jgi:hypothetical protein
MMAKIIAWSEQIEFAKVHTPHRIAVMLAPFDESAAFESRWPLRDAMLHGSFVAFRSLMDFIGLKDDGKALSPALIPCAAKKDDVTLASFGLPLLSVADLSRNEAILLARVYRVANKAIAHITSNSGHPVLDTGEYREACQLLHALLEKHLLSRY